LARRPIRISSQKTRAFVRIRRTFGRPTRPPDVGSVEGCLVGAWHSGIGFCSNSICPMLCVQVSCSACDGSASIRQFRRSQSWKPHTKERFALGKTRGSLTTTPIATELARVGRVEEAKHGYISTGVHLSQQNRRISRFEQLSQPGVAQTGRELELPKLTFQSSGAPSQHWPRERHGQGCAGILRHSRTATTRMSICRNFPKGSGRRSTQSTGAENRYRWRRAVATSVYTSTAKPATAGWSRRLGSRDACNQKRIEIGQPKALQKGSWKDSKPSSTKVLRFAAICCQAAREGASKCLIYM